MRFFIQTFGCQMNENDSRLLAGLLVSAGHQKTEDIEQADVAIVNTCCIRESAENRAYGYLGSLNKFKQDNKNRILAVFGCMAQKDGTVEKLVKSYRHIDIISGTFAASQLPRYIEEFAATRQRIVDVKERYDLPNLCREEQPQSITIENGYRAQVNINFGCNNFCSYCIVPYVRGRERSRLPEEILSEVKSLAEQGVSEIQLLGQNVNSYGQDLKNGCNFANLLIEINKVSGVERIRYMTSHPRDLDLQLIETIAELDKVCRHFHFPLQSGTDRILAQMNRGYSVADYHLKLEHIRRTCPNATLTTDLIVGFPGETESDFLQTLDYLRQAEFDAAYTFIYSPRSGTPAATMPNQISEDVKRDRIQRLLDVQNDISNRINRSLIGKILPVMVDGTSKNNPEMSSGRTDGNKIVVFANPQQIAPGKLIDIKITEAQTWNLKVECL